MSLFINSLAFENLIYAEQAKMGILTASLVSGFIGYMIIRHATRGNAFKGDETMASRKLPGRGAR